MCDGKGVVFPAVWGVTLNDAGGSEWVTVYMNSKNLLSQIRKGISQLYEYRYIYSKPNAKLCIVGNHNIGKSNSWLLHYLSIDRLIAFEWTDNYHDFYCDKNSKKILSEFAP